MLGIWWCHDVQISENLKFDYLENEESFWSEMKIFFLVSQVLSSRHAKQTSENVADRTFNIQNTISKVNRSLNKDLKELSFLLNANKIALNVAKTEVILFKIKHKPCDTDLRLKLCRKRLYKTKYLRYLGIKIDENLKWKIDIHDLASKLNRANAVLEKLRHFVNSEILKVTSTTKR